MTADRRSRGPVPRLGSGHASMGCLARVGSMTDRLTALAQAYAQADENESFDADGYCVHGEASGSLCVEWANAWPARVEAYLAAAGWRIEAEARAGLDVLVSQEGLAQALHAAKIGCWGPEPIHDAIPDAVGQTEVGCTVRWNGTTPSSHEYEAAAILSALAPEVGA